MPISSIVAAAGVTAKKKKGAFLNGLGNKKKKLFKDNKKGKTNKNSILSYFYK